MTLEARARDLDRFFMVKLSEVKSLEPRQGKVPDDMKNLVFPAIFYRVNQEKKAADVTRFGAFLRQKVIVFKEKILAVPGR